jgi:signal transduction histidine kinase
LTDNAVVHAFEQGRRAGRITISAAREGQLLHLRFADDGVGIEPGRRARIFDPFDAAAGKPGSRGLGLFICHHIVTARLSGSISCDSSPQAGCRFDIRFPAHFVGSGQDAPA